jgi:hypothetical protein
MPPNDLVERPRAGAHDRALYRSRPLQRRVIRHVHWQSIDTDWKWRSSYIVDTVREPGPQIGLDTLLARRL